MHLSGLRVAVSAGLLAAWSLGAAAATAATLNLVADKPSYAPGETVTLRLIGDSEGGTDVALAAMVHFDPAALLDVQVQTFLPPSGTSNPWLEGGRRGCFQASKCYLMNAIYAGPLGPVGPIGMDPAIEPFTYAVLTATAGVPGLHQLFYANNIGGAVGKVIFFGLTYSPGTTVLIHNPEPGTAALLALGLAGLSLAGRRRN